MTTQTLMYISIAILVIIIVNTVVTLVLRRRPHEPFDVDSWCMRINRIGFLLEFLIGMTLLYLGKGEGTASVVGVSALMASLLILIVSHTIIYPGSGHGDGDSGG